jgi:hypothetical protein
MEQSLRLQPGQPVDVLLLGPAGGRFLSRILRISGRRVCLEVPARLDPGQAMRIEAGDDALLGEVVGLAGSLQRSGNRPVSGAETLVATVELDQVLTGLAALGRMLRQFADEPLRAEPVNASQNRDQQDHQQSH